jgi:arylsulfatase A-like enzyme
MGQRLDRERREKKLGLRRLKEKLSRRKFIRGFGGLVATGLWPCGIRAADSHSGPNVLFVMTDQQRFPYVGAYGEVSVKTPAMDSIARGGALFTHAFCSTPQCSASRSSIMTGLYPHTTGVMGNIGAAGGNSLKPELPSLGTVFRGANYQTGYFGKWHLGGDPHDHGFQAYHGCGRGIGEDVAEKSAAFLTDVKEPFFLFCSFVNPHDIYGFARLKETIARSKERVRIPANLHDDLSKRPQPQLQYLREDQGKAAQGLTDQDWTDYLNVYEYLVEKVDGNIGKILEALERRGLARRTIIVFTSDHGDHGGAHGLPFKGPAMYEELVRIPLAVSFPDEIPPGRRLNDLVVNVDLLPTLCDLAGLPVPKRIHGRSLKPLLRGNKVAWRDYVIGEYYSKQRWVNPIRMVRTRERKYTRYRKWGEELYDLRSDPGELNNLAGSETHAASRRKLSAVLDEWIRRTGDPFESLFPTDRQGKTV